MTALLHVEIHTNQHQRGVTDGTTNMLPGVEHTQINHKHVQSLIHKKIHIPSGKDTLQQIVELHMEQPLFPQGALLERCNGDRALIVGKGLRIELLSPHMACPNWWLLILILFLILFLSR